MALPIDPGEEPRMYQQTLLQDGLYDLLENDKLVDCVLKIKDKKFPCHRLVLCACSSFFRTLFLSNLDEEKKREVILEDVEPGVMGLILKYLYTSTINVTEQNVQDIFTVANLFQIPSIFTVCVSFLQKRLSLSNSLAIFRLGLMLDCPRLAVSARNYACERFTLIARDDDFLALGPSELAAILTSDTLNVEKEEEVFEAVEKWVGQDVETRLKDLPDLMDCVRLRLVNKDYFTEMVEKHEWIHSNPDMESRLQLVRDAYAGKLPDLPPKKSEKKKTEENGGIKKEGEEGEEAEEEEDEEEALLPGILNDNLRFGMFLRDLLFMISDTGAVAYDPTGNDCYVASLSTQIPKNHASLVTKENQIFVAGGFFYNELNKEEPLSSYFLQYDPVSADWLGMPPIPSPRFLFGLAEAENNIFVVGGKELKEQDTTLDSVLIYNRQTFKWAESDPLPYPVYGHATVSHDRLIYAIGGKSDDKEVLNRMCVYDALSSQWNEMAPMQTARSLFGATVHKSQIYVAAGVTQTGLTGTMEIYNIQANQWSEFVEFPQGRSSLSLASVGEGLYAVGGFALMPLEDEEELLPKEINDIWRFDEEDRKWVGVLREIQYSSGATILGVRLNTLRLAKM